MHTKTYRTSKQIFNKFAQDSDKVRKKMQRTLKEKYWTGTKLFSENPTTDFKEKLKQTNLEKFGIEKHGIEHPSTMKKATHKNLERYGTALPLKIS